MMQTAGGARVTRCRCHRHFPEAENEKDPSQTGCHAPSLVRGSQSATSLFKPSATETERLNYASCRAKVNISSRAYSSDAASPGRVGALDRLELLYALLATVTETWLAPSTSVRNALSR